MVDERESQLAEINERLKVQQSSATKDESAIRATELQQKAARARLEQVNSQLRHCLTSLEQVPELDPSKIDPSAKRATGQSDELASELAKLRVEYDDLLLKYGNAHPKVIELGNKIEERKHQTEAKY